MSSNKDEAYESGTRDRLEITSEEKILSDVGAERAILACIMKDPTRMLDASTKLMTDDFFEEESRYLYAIILKIYTKNGGKNCFYDITSLRSLARDGGKEEDFLIKTGHEYIEYLTVVKDSLTQLENFDSYVTRVIDLSVKRKLIKANDRFKEEILKSTKTSEELMVQERLELDTLFVNNSASGSKFKSLGDTAGTFIKNAMSAKKTILGIPTLFKELDSTIEGLKRKNLVIVSAAKKTGKSAFLLNIGLNVGVRQKIPTLMISTEMSDEEILARALANLSNVKEKDILKGSLTDRDRIYLDNAQALFENGKFYHTFCPAFTLEKVIGIIRRFVNNIVGMREDGTPKDCLIVFDYIKMPQGSTSTSKDAKEYKLLGELTNGLKIEAGLLDIPILAACQTNRGGDVANSYEITWYCNTFAILENKSKKELEKDQMNSVYLGNQRLRITDNRGGDEHYEGIDLDFNKPTLLYQEIEKEKPKN